jgi:hypothetical protein
MNEAPKVYVPSQVMLDLVTMLNSKGVANIPVKGEIISYDHDLGQIEAVVWRTVTKDAKWATTPEEAHRFVSARPALVGTSEVEWAAKLSECYAQMETALRYMQRDLKMVRGG